MARKPTPSNQPQNVAPQQQKSQKSQQLPSKPGKNTQQAQQQSKQSKQPQQPQQQLSTEQIMESKLQKAKEARQEMLQQVYKNDLQSCPYFSLALRGDKEGLENLIDSTLLIPENQLQFKHTNIVQIPSASHLFAPLRLIDTQSGSTLLHLACMGKVEVVKLLLKYGMNIFINSRNSQGCTPIFLAAGRGKLDIVRTLVESGALITIHTKDGASILHAAVLSGNFELVYYLLSLPSLEVNIDDDEFMTPFGLIITRISELKKQVTEMTTVLSETIRSIVQNAETFIIDENERIDAAREEFGLNDAANLNEEGKPIEPITLPDGQVVEFNYLTSKDQADLVKEILDSNETINSLKDGVSQGEILLKDSIKIAQILMNPPVFRLTLPEIVREIGTDVPEIEERQAIQQLATTDDTTSITTTTTITDSSYTDTTVSTTDDDNKSEASYDSMPELSEISSIALTDQSVTDKTTFRRAGKQIFHAPQRAKIIHFPPLISYWMLIIETQELDLISTCIERCEIDINWTFPLGDKVSNATALHYAIDLENLAIIKLLIENGADLGFEMKLSLAPHLDLEEKAKKKEEKKAAAQGGKKGTPQNPTEKMNAKMITNKQGQQVPNKAIIVDDGYELLIAMVQIVKEKTDFALSPVNPKDKEKVATMQQLTANKTLDKIPSQQGFTPFLAALYNQQHEIAKYILSRGHLSCLGSSYLKTHHITPYPNLLTVDLLETLPSQDLEIHLAKQETVSASDANQIVNKSSIVSFMDLLYFLFPHLSTPCSTELKQQYEAELAVHQRKLQKIKTKAEAEGTPVDQTTVEFVEMKKTLLQAKGYTSPMIPDALRVAITNGYDDIVHQLLSLGVEINTPYFFAQVHMVKIQPRIDEAAGIEYHYTVAIELTDLGFTPIFNAIKSQNTNIFRQLLSIGAKLNISLYDYLLKNGLDINSNIYLPLFTPNADNIDNVADQVIRVNFYSPTPTLPPIIQAVQYHPDIIHMMVAHQPQVLTQLTNEGRTALHYTCELNKPIASTYILSNNPLAMFIRDRFGFTPLSFTVVDDKMELCSILLNYLKRLRSCVVSYHPQRLIPVNTGEKGKSYQDVFEIYSSIDEDKTIRYYPQLPTTQRLGTENQLILSDLLSSSQTGNLDDIDASDDEEPALEPVDEIEKTTNKFLVPDNEDVILPYWIDEIAEMKPFIFSPIGFDASSFQTYNNYVQTMYYPQIQSDSNILSKFVSYHPDYSSISFSPLEQQLQSHPFRWFGFDISCANILSLYYNIINNHRDHTNDRYISFLEPITKSIDGCYGQIIRCFRLAAMTGSIMTLKSLSDSFVAYPQININKLSNQPELSRFTPIDPYALWVELIVPTSQQLATTIFSAGGYTLLQNNIVLDSHGFIARNVTYEYAAQFYKITLGSGKLSTTRLCLPLLSYLATETLSSIAKQGFTSIALDLLSKQALPLLHGLHGSSFIRCFHQYYLCNPLHFDNKTKKYNWNGIITNRVPSLPFTPYMINDVARIVVPMSFATNHFVVTKTSFTQRIWAQRQKLLQQKLLKEQQNQKGITQKNKNKSHKNKQDVLNDDDTEEEINLPLLLDSSPKRSLSEICIYKSQTYSPLHLAVINDQLQVVRLLIGLSPSSPSSSEAADIETDEDYNTTILTTMDDNGTNDEEDDEQIEGNDCEPLLQIDEKDSGVSPNKSFDDIQLNQQHTKTLYDLVKALNLEQHYEELQKLTQAQQQIDQLQSQAHEDAVEQSHPLEKDMDGLKSLAKQMDQVVSNDWAELQAKLQLTTNLPSLLLIPQPQDPIFQLINRLVLQPMIIQKYDETTKMVEEQTVNTITHVLHLCALHDLSDIGELLIQYGAVIDIQDHDGNTPLHVAIRDGSRTMLESLLTYNASLIIQNNEGNTPLHLAALSGMIELVHIIIKEYRPDTTIKNYDGKTVIDLLVQGQKDYETHQQAELDLIKDENGDGVLSFNALFSPSNQPLKNTNLQGQSVEERRQYNREQIQLLRNEVNKLRGPERTD